MNFAEKLKQLMAQNNILWKDLAAEFGIAVTSLSYWAKYDKMPSSETIIKMAQKFNVSADYLLGLTEDRNEDLKFALFGGDGEITDAMLEEVKAYAMLVKARNKTQ